MSLFSGLCPSEHRLPPAIRSDGEASAWDTDRARKTGFASVSGFAPQKPSPQRRACHCLAKKLSHEVTNIPAQHGIPRARAN